MIMSSEDTAQWPYWRGALDRVVPKENAIYIYQRSIIFYHYSGIVEAGCVLCGGPFASQFILLMGQSPTKHQLGSFSNKIMT